MRLFGDREFMMGSRLHMEDMAATLYSLPALPIVVSLEEGRFIPPTYPN